MRQRLLTSENRKWWTPAAVAFGRTTLEVFVHGLSVALTVAAGIAFAGAGAAATLVRTHYDTSNAREPERPRRVVGREA
jgi:hypothetical protein